MQTRVLGSTGIAISRIVLGCGTFGGVGSPLAFVGKGLSEDAAFAAMDEAVALGVNLFDTAHAYGGGASEAMMGRWLSAQSPDLRAGVRIATKVGVVHEGHERRIDLSPGCIAHQVDSSLQRLGLDRVDFCLTHFPDLETPIEATLEGFAAAIAAGKVAHIGACNISAPQLRDALAASERLGLPRYELIQNEYNLTKRADETDVFRACEEFNLGVTPYSPLAGGKLTGKYGRGEPADPGSRLGMWPGSELPSARQFDAIDLLRREGARRSVSPGAMALAWVIAHPLVTAALAGPCRTPEHLQIAREALSINLDSAMRDQISRWFEIE
jgi:aryl-alcohol dehydrogenase-like predicted oxidoreductase